MTGFVHRVCSVSYLNIGPMAINGGLALFSCFTRARFWQAGRGEGGGIERDETTRAHCRIHAGSRSLQAVGEPRRQPVGRRGVAKRCAHARQVPLETAGRERPRKRGRCVLQLPEVCKPVHPGRLRTPPRAPGTLHWAGRRHARHVQVNPGVELRGVHLAMLAHPTFRNSVGTQTQIPCFLPR